MQILIAHLLLVLAGALIGGYTVYSISRNLNYNRMVQHPVNHSNYAPSHYENDHQSRFWSNLIFILIIGFLVMIGWSTLQMLNSDHNSERAKEEKTLSMNVNVRPKPNKWIKKREVPIPKWGIQLYALDNQESALEQKSFWHHQLMKEIEVFKLNQKYCVVVLGFQSKIEANNYIQKRHLSGFSRMISEYEVK